MNNRDVSDCGGPSGRENRSVRLVDLARVLVRAFLIQAWWNFHRMQNVGFLFSLWPVLKRLYPDKRERRDVAFRHLEFFNTHPCMANVVLGVVAGLEQEHVRRGAVSRDQIHSVKEYMAGPLAALGDTIFWAAWRPFSAILAVAIGWHFVGKEWLFIPLLFLLIYNGLNFFMRYWGVFHGFYLKVQVIPFLVRLNVQSVVQWVYLLGIGLTVGALMTLCLRFEKGLLWSGIFVPVSLFFLIFTKKVTSSHLLYIWVIGFVLLSVAGVI